ncbi:MAG: Ig-like domain-containing protein [Oscillospiraceae bacterium]|jgi:uncharacterized membrane protein YgcG|nr:Ig-like domain-containing protein [Oscillospiraceae bacterium]
MKKALLCMCIIAGVAASSRLFPARASAAGSVTDTISVSIGYFGWDEDEFVEKAKFTWQELDDMFGGALATREMVYSYFSGSRTYLVAARGFYIRDLLEYAGIDFGSISRIDFFTKDQTVGAYRSFTKQSLFDLPRYYFPNLAANEATGALYPYYGDDVYDGAVQVEPMLALEDYTEWDSVGREFEQLYDSTMFSAAARFHLFFGQLDPSEANTSSAAKYVYKLLITFSGTPVLSTEETNISLKVGSDFKMTVNVSAEDSLLDEYVSENLLWSSNNDAVVSVDRYGNLTVNGEGDAVITASFGSASVSATVRVSGGEVVAVPPPVGSSGGGTGTGGGGSGGGTGSGSGSGGASSGQTAPPSVKPPSAPAVNPPEQVQFSENNKGVYILSSDFVSQAAFAEWVNSVLNHDYLEGGGGGLDNSRKEGMDGDAEQLILLARDGHSFISVVFFILAVFFVLGFGLEILSFKRKL